MKKVPYTNNTANRMTVAGVAVRPGETRYIDQTLHPDYRSQGAAPQEPTDPVLELLDDSVKNIIPKLPELSEEDFYSAWQGEVDGKTRSSLIAAFEEEKLRRAEAAAEQGEGAEDDGGGEEGE